MKDKLLNSIKASWPYLLTLIIGLYLAEILAGAVMALSRYKLTFADHMPTVLKQLALHPWHYYNLYLDQKEPSTNYCQCRRGPIHHLFCLETK